MTDGQVIGDNGGVFQSAEQVTAYLKGGNDTTPPAYHSDRMRALRLLLDQADIPDRARVVDFGCGDGMYFRELFDSAAIEQITGVDLYAPMIAAAEQSLSALPFKGVVGGAAALRDLAADSFDLGLAIDVLGYLNADELDVFYTEMARIIRPGGGLIVMYGNELFDMYALNAGTARFFEKHLDADVTDLLTEASAKQFEPVVRKNPLSFGAEIAPYGFAEIGQSFSQWHVTPPGLGNRGANVAEARRTMRDHAFDPNTLPPTTQWTAMFRSSIFASLSRR